MLNTRNISTQLINELMILTILNLLVAELSYNSVRTGYEGKVTQTVAYSNTNNTTLKHLIVYCEFYNVKLNH